MNTEEAIVLKMGQKAIRGRGGGTSIRRIAIICNNVTEVYYCFSILL
jgi:hypothetical protein